MQITQGDDILTGKLGRLPSPGELPLLPHQTGAARHVQAATPGNSGDETLSPRQSEKQRLTLAEIKVHIMFVVSNLWMSFEKQSAWKTAGQPSHKGAKKPGHTGPPRKDAVVETRASLWSHRFLGDVALAPKRQGKQHT